MEKETTRTRTTTDFRHSLRLNHLKRKENIKSQQRRIKQLHKQHYQLHLTRLTFFSVRLLQKI